MREKNTLAVTETAQLQVPGYNTYVQYRKYYVFGFISLIVFASLKVAAKNTNYAWINTPKGNNTTHKLSYEERVDVILKQTPLIGKILYKTYAFFPKSKWPIYCKLTDGHNDLADIIRTKFHNHIYSSNFTEPFIHGGLMGHVDLPRLAKGKVGGTFWSVYVECPVNVTDYSNQNYAESVRQTVSQVDLVRRLQKEYPETFSDPPNGTTAMHAFRSGRIISPLGLEGLHSIGNSFSQLRMFYEIGVRYATLAHYCHNLFADAAVVNTAQGGLEIPDPLWHGISDLGKKAVFEMNRLGMLVDLAHVSHDTMRDVLGSGNKSWTGSLAPTIFSHSSAYALCPHPRNVPDDVLDLVKNTGSVVMVTFVPYFISCIPATEDKKLPAFDPSNSTISRVVEHIMYIGERIGYQHVGLGSDFNGIPTTPEGIDDVSSFPKVIELLLRKQVSDEDVAFVAGGSLLRVWKRVDEVAQELRFKGARPVEDIDGL
ncbi:dipeptidase [Fusarium proliferatum]|uniref:Dipeptidase n=1 Tax=Gibberella intermedia TaxID=948311 RepID=A0A365MTQ5_GIBIN|nr:dipeptidase [Fusarium proliferatum]